MRKLIVLLVGAVLASACGGGGSGDPDFLTFDRTTATQNVPEGASNYTSILTGHANWLPDTTPVIKVVSDSNWPFTGAEMTFDTSTLEGELHLPIKGGLVHANSPYTGTFELHVCYDASCQSEYRGSPYHLSYSINVLAP